MKSKWYHLSLLTVVLALLSGCAATNPNTVATHVAKPEQQSASVEQSGDREFLYSAVTEKLKGLSVKGLEAVNSFVDAHFKADAGVGNEVVVLALDTKRFPFFLERVMKSNQLLSTLPRDRERLVVVENMKVPGVRNVYYRVKATEVPEGKQYAQNWAPEGSVFKKHIDPKENLVGDKKPEEQFMTLFYLGNYHYNQDLIISMQGEDGSWDWWKMAHPKDTMFQEMLIPIATVKNGAMEVMTLDLKPVGEPVATTSK